MHRLAAAACAVGLSLTLAACGGQDQPATPPASQPAPATSEAATPEATPSPAASETPAPTAAPTPGADPASPAPGGATDPEKLDAAMLKPEDLPGWQAAEISDAPADETVVEPAACSAVNSATLGKVASDMGAAAGFDSDDRHLAEFLDLVDRGSDSVADLEKVLATCGSFTMTDAGEKTPVTATRFDVPAIGERAIGIRLTLQGDAPIDVLAIVAGQRDVVLTTTLQSEHPDPAVLVDVTKKAMAKVTATI